MRKDSSLNWYMNTRVLVTVQVSQDSPRFFNLSFLFLFTVGIHNARESISNCMREINSELAIILCLFRTYRRSLIRAANLPFNFKQLSPMYPETLAG